MRIVARIMSAHGPLTGMLDMDVVCEPDGPSRYRWVGSFKAPDDFAADSVAAGIATLELRDGTTASFFIWYTDGSVVYFHCPGAPKLAGA